VANNLSSAFIHEAQLTQLFAAFLQNSSPEPSPPATIDRLFSATNRKTVSVNSNQNNGKKTLVKQQSSESAGMWVNFSYLKDLKGSGPHATCFVFVVLQMKQCF